MCKERGLAMVVYLDLLILDNFCADAALLYCAVRTVKGEVKWWRIALAALLGTALAVAYTMFGLYFSIPPPVDLLVKYGVAAVLPLPAAKYKRGRTCALCSLAFIGYMAAFAGVLTALFAADMPNAGEEGLVYTFGGLPSGVLVAACVAFGFLAARLIGVIAAHARAVAATCRCVLTLGERKVTLTAFVDSGNRLRDGRGEPVVVAERAAALALLQDRLFCGGQMGSGAGQEKSDMPGGRIAVQTVNGTSYFSCFRIDRLEIYCGKAVNIIENVTVAVSPGPLAGEYGALLPPSYAKEKDFQFRGGRKCCKRFGKCSGNGRKR